MAIITLLAIKLFSCDENRPQKSTFLYNEEFEGQQFFEKLHGNVHQLKIADRSRPNDNFTIVQFDGDGNVRAVSEKATSITRDQFGANKTISQTETDYTPTYTKYKTVDGLVGRSHLRVKSAREENVSDDTYSVRLSYNLENNKPVTVFNYPGEHRQSDRYTYKFDKDGRIATESLFDDKRRLRTIRYKYLKFDAKNNWTTLIKITNTYPPMSRGTTTDTLTRQFIYFSE